MKDRKSRTLLLFLCISVSRSQISGKKPVEDTEKSKELKSRDGKLVAFDFASPATYSVDTGAAHIPPSRNSHASPFNKLPSAFVINFERPAVLEELDEIKKDGLGSISNGLQDVASYVGGKIGYFLGANGGYRISNFAGKFRGVPDGANTGAVIGANVASAPFNVINRRGSTNRNRFRNRGSHVSPSYAQDINTRRRPSHHNRRIR